jgi:lipopolysaccharide transport system permease protein
MNPTRFHPGPELPVRPSASGPARPNCRCRARMSTATPIWKQIWESRYFLYNLMVRNLKSSTKRSLLGYLWFVIKPFVFLALYSFAFTYIIRIKVAAFPAFLFCGLLPWNYLSSTLLSGVESVSSNASLIKAVCFPREILPLASVLVQLIQFVISFIVFLPFLLFMGVRPGVGWAMLPVVILLQTLFVVGIVFCLAAVNVNWRDVRHIVDVFIQAWFWVTPIVYPLEMIPERIRPWIYVNPFTVFVDGYRSLLLKNELPSIAVILGMMVAAVSSLTVGAVIFGRRKHRFAEEI